MKHLKYTQLHNLEQYQHKKVIWYLSEHKQHIKMNIKASWNLLTFFVTAYNIQLSYTSIDISIWMFQSQFVIRSIISEYFCTVQTNMAVLVFWVQGFGIGFGFLGFSVDDYLISGWHKIEKNGISI